jgi:ABC-type polysaccharide/polyol phosphate export permease
VYFRDLQNILVFGLRLWFYLSPALFSIADRIPPTLRPIYMLNPFSSLFNAYKNILVRGLPPSVYIWAALGFGVVFLAFGLWLFDKMEHRLAKDV